MSLFKISQPIIAAPKAPTIWESQGVYMASFILLSIAFLITLDIATPPVKAISPFTLTLLKIDTPLFAME